MSIECYAQRLLNPFRGVMQIMRYASAEAVSLDGVTWDIYVANEELLRDIADRRRTQISDIRYGNWSATAGLKRGPLFPSNDFRRMEIMGAIVYEYLTRHHGSVPFSLADRFEFWLLDSERRPLALLASATTESDTGGEQTLDWRAGYAARDRFSSSAVAGNAADALTRHINSLAGSTPVAQWFAREPDDGGTGLCPGPAAESPLAGTRLDAGAFPRFFLREAGHDAVHARLVGDYLAWQAPWLLLLSGLDEETRRRLEGYARAQATEVEQQHRLYPAVADTTQVHAALVEARLLRHADAAREAPSSLSPNYIEVNPCSGGNYN